MAGQTAESVGSVTPADPSSVGAQQTDAAYAAVHPQTAPAPAPDTGGAPGEAPRAEAGQPEADWKASLSPDVQKHVDRVITELRQKDTGRIRDLEAQAQRLGWAEDLNRMAASENPADRQRAVALLEATLGVLKQGVPGKPEDPLAGIDLQNLEAIVPGVGKAIQHLAAENARLAKTLGETNSVVQNTAYQTAERALAIELGDLESWATSNGLPFDRDIVIAKENALGITDLRAAYYAAYGENLVGAGKKAAQEGLSAKKAASLPGGSVGGGQITRPKFASMQDQWNYLKRERGITGPVEYKG